MGGLKSIHHGSMEGGDNRDTISEGEIRPGGDTRGLQWKQWGGSRLRATERPPGCRRQRSVRRDRLCGPYGDHEYLCICSETTNVPPNAGCIGATPTYSNVNTATQGPFVS